MVNGGVFEEETQEVSQWKHVFMNEKPFLYASCTMFYKYKQLKKDKSYWEQVW